MVQKQRRARGAGFGQTDGHADDVLGDAVPCGSTGGLRGESFQMMGPLEQTPSYLESQVPYFQGNSCWF